MAKKKVVVIGGGPSHEYEVSLASTRQIITNLQSDKYAVSTIKISKHNNWSFGNDLDDVKGELGLLDGLKKLVEISPDIVFLGLHGNFGEDGKIQSFLETLNIPFTGSGSFASSLAMDKVVSQELMHAHGLEIIKTVDFWRDDWEMNKEKILDLCSSMGRAIMVKPADGGSSVGICKNLNRDNLEKDIIATLKHTEHVMVQPCVEGREFSCGVLEQEGSLNSLPATEIIPKSSEFFDYDAKYTPGASEEITPANIEPELMMKIQEAAAKAHLAHGCQGYSRTDFILSENGLFVLELNTLPGMTETSILPQQAKAAGIGFSSLLDAIIEAGLQ